jgi:FSR family fosmidomycin resistance protein-like MFS transporter
MSQSAATSISARQTEFPVLGAISVSHMLNDMIQSLILAIYPILQGNFHLSFAQIGLITFTYQLTASLLQPLIGSYTDKHPKPYSLPIGMAFTLCGLLLLSVAPSYIFLLMAAALTGIGSSVFHPESSRVARMASGGRYGLAQSIFQVGGNMGSSLGPLLAAMIIAPYGRGNIAWFSLAALLAMFILFQVSKWYKSHLLSYQKSARAARQAQSPFSQKRIVFIIGVLLVLLFSKYFYLGSISSYYTFYLIDKFHLSIKDAQIHLFFFLFSVALGTLFGGPLGDRIGRKYVIWGSILGVSPFTMLLPWVDSLFMTSLLSIIIGLILSSAFSAILVYAQALLPGKVGTIAGMFFGLSFGLGALGAAVLGWVADMTSIATVYHICAFLPLLGVVAIFLPNLKEQ